MSIDKPIERSVIRRLIGKEFYILKRKIVLLLANEKWAKQAKGIIATNSVFQHRSLILRPLKDVDMILQENKRTNLKLAVDKLNGITLQPGEILSFWHSVGRPSRRKGYLMGLVLNQGKIDKGVGGGLCQLGNLLFWMTAHTPLTITERHRHSFDVFPDVSRSVPFGAGATLAYNYIDLQIKNETSNTYQLRLWLDDEYLNGEYLSILPECSNFKIEEREHIIRQESWGGYSRHNVIYKIEQTESGNLIESKLVENHALMMYSPLIDSVNSTNLEE
jgi:vancomycin resistance protein VanW